MELGLCARPDRGRQQIEDLAFDGRAHAAMPHYAREVDP
jgi:hypothetical protein